MVAQIAFRAHHMRRLLGDFSVLRQLVRAALPVLPGTVTILATRLAAGPAETALLALAEASLFVAMTIASTAWFERVLLREVTGYLRRPRGAAVPTATA